MSRNEQNEKKESEILRDLKERLWAKIQVLDAKLQSTDEKKDGEEYRKTMDAYHKIVKAYMDIVKVQRYAPGNLQDQQSEDDIVKMIRKVRARESLTAADKIALQEFKDFLHYVKKSSLSKRKVRR